MHKSMQGLHLLKKDNDSIATKDLVVETTKGGETRLNLNAINIFTTTPIPSCNPADIIPRLIKVYKESMMRPAWIVLIIAFVPIILSGICFSIVIQYGIDQSTVRLLGSGIGAVITSLSLLAIFCTLCDESHNGLNWMNRVVQIIQLNGQTWQSQLDSNRDTALAQIIGRYYVGDRCDRLKMRPQGYIGVAEDGIIIDELFAIRYDTYIARRIDLIDNTTDTGNGLRLFLATRHKSEDRPDNGKQIEFEVYLFIAAHMQAHELTNIRQSILSNWDKCLTASGLTLSSRMLPNGNNESK